MNKNTQLEAELARRDAAAGEPVAVLYRNGDVLTKAECGEYFEICCKVETPLYTAPPAATVPEGWKLVPIEPTQRMIDAHTEGMVSGGATRAYRDMLEAATAPGGDGG